MFLFSRSLSHSGRSIFHSPLHHAGLTPNIFSVAKISPMAITPLGTMISNPSRGIQKKRHRKTETEREGTRSLEIHRAMRTILYIFGVPQSGWPTGHSSIWSCCCRSQAWPVPDQTVQPTGPPPPSPGADLRILVYTDSWYHLRSDKPNRSSIRDRGTVSFNAEFHRPNWDQLTITYLVDWLIDFLLIDLSSSLIKSSTDRTTPRYATGTTWSCWPLLHRILQVPSIRFSRR